MKYSLKYVVLKPPGGRKWVKMMIKWWKSQVMASKVKIARSHCQPVYILNSTLITTQYNHCFTVLIQVSASTSSWELEDFVGTKFYCPYILAGGSQCIQIREKMLQFSSTLLPTLSPYLVVVHLSMHVISL